MTSSTVFCQQLFARRQEQRYIHSVSLTSFLPAFPCLFAASALFLPFFLLKFKYMSIEHIQQVQVTSTLQAFYCILFVLFYFLIFLFSFVRLPVRCTLYFVFCVWRKIGNFLLPECKKREKKKLVCTFANGAQTVTTSSPAERGESQWVAVLANK